MKGDDNLHIGEEEEGGSITGEKGKGKGEKERRRSEEEKKDAKQKESETRRAKKKMERRKCGEGRGARKKMRKKGKNKRSKKKSKIYIISSPSYLLGTYSTSSSLSLLSYPPRVRFVLRSGLETSQQYGNSSKTLLPDAPSSKNEIVSKKRMS